MGDLRAAAGVAASGHRHFKDEPHHSPAVVNQRRWSKHRKPTNLPRLTRRFTCLVRAMRRRAYSAHRDTVGPAMSCCVATQGSALARRHLSLPVEMEATRVKCLCEGPPFRSMGCHIQFAGDGSSNIA
jgi:hypothetical protein